MKVLIIYAHPEPTSLNSFMKNIAVEILTGNGHEVKVSDLYEMNFKAVADKNDFKELHNPIKFNYIMEQSFAAKNRSFSDDILTEQDKILWADLILFQFPIWWTESPAILKGWFDRVFAYNFAYGPGAYDKGNLQGKKAILSITHGGANENNYGKYGIKGDLNERLFNIQHEKLYFCGIDVIEPFVLSSTADEALRLKQIEEFKSRLKNIDKQPLIQFHPLSHYEKGQLLTEYREDEVSLI